jgi:uncharacterized protein YjiS (DUF1127 family)
MPCAGPSHSCNSLITIRSPFGDVRIGSPDSTAPSSRPVWLLARTYLALREWLAHRMQRWALQTLDQHLLDDIGVSKPDAANEARKFF